MVHCPSCKAPITPEHSYSRCTKCEAPLPLTIIAELKWRQASAHSNSAPELGDHRSEEQLETQARGEAAINVLRIAASLILVGGITAVIVVSRLLQPGSSDASPVGILLGFLCAIGGVMVLTLLLVICSAAENLIAIRKNTMKH